MPRHCAGCGTPGAHLCAACRQELARPPARVTPRVDVHVPVYSFGPYAHVHRNVVLAMKERNNLAVRKHVGAVLRAGLEYLEARGDVPAPTVLVPAPTRAFAARSRGGDPVRAVCEASGRQVAPVLSTPGRVRDQGELNAAERRTNLAGRIALSRVPTGDIVLIDDVVTTGATLQASVETLLAGGGRVVAALALCSA